MDCIFCEEGNPCEAHRPKPSKAKAKATSPKKPRSFASANTTVTSSGSTSSSLPPTLPKRTRFDASKIETQDEDFLITREGIRNLVAGGLVRFEDLTPEHQKYIDPPKSAAVMKMREELRRSGNGLLE